MMPAKSLLKRLRRVRVYGTKKGAQQRGYKEETNTKIWLSFINLVSKVSFCLYFCIRYK